MSPYQKPFPNNWWLKRMPYFLFIIRELTSVFVAGYCLFLLVLIYKLGQGPEVYGSLIKSLTSSTSIVLHFIALVFVLYHTVTWFNLTPKIMPMYVAEEKVQDVLLRTNPQQAQRSPAELLMRTHWPTS
ncbi:MAG: fumarate reductase subunit C [Bacteroidetes bacterium]|nr:fumarate reductase subunit C [Bacteroidota bacterium]